MIKVKIVSNNGVQRFIVTHENGVIKSYDKQSYDQLKLKGNGENCFSLNGSDSISNGHTNNDKTSSTTKFENFPVVLSCIVGIGLIKFFIKVGYSLPWIIGLIVLVLGVWFAIKGIESGARFSIGRALMVCVAAIIIFVAIMFVLTFFSFLFHCLSSFKETSTLHETSGFNRNMNIGVGITALGAFLMGGFLE